MKIRDQNGQKIPIRMLGAFSAHIPPLLARLIAFFSFEVKIFHSVHSKHLMIFKK
jgi:hypothetical protein